METYAPGITAPDGSVTVPLMVPEFDWACGADNTSENARANREKRMLRVNGRMDKPTDDR